MKLLLMEYGIRETFAHGIGNPWNFCLWSPESGKILLVKSSIGENFACGSRNRGKFCFWNVESGKILLVEYGIREKFACGILNPGKVCLWNPESGKSLLVASRILEFGIRNTAQGIRSPTNDWNPQSKCNWQRLEWSTWNPESTGVESRIQHYLGFPRMGVRRAV